MRTVHTLSENTDTEVPYVLHLSYQAPKTILLNYLAQPGLELSGLGLNPRVHVYRRLFLSENWF